MCSINNYYIQQLIHLNPELYPFGCLPLVNFAEYFYKTNSPTSKPSSGNLLIHHLNTEGACLSYKTIHLQSSFQKLVSQGH